MRRKHLVGVIVMFNLTIVVAWAQRTEAPTAADITAAARGVELNRAGVAREKDGPVEVTFTPIKQPAKFTPKMLEDGMVLGELRPKNLAKELSGGLFTIYVCKVGKRFDAFAVRDDKLLKLPMAATVETNAFKTAKAAPNAKVELITDGKQKRFVRTTLEIGQERVVVTIGL